MSDLQDAFNIARYDPGRQRRRPGGGSPLRPLTRRAFLRTAAGTGALLVSGAAGEALGTRAWPAPDRRTAAAAPDASPAAGGAASVARRRYHSRPDLTPVTISVSGPRIGLAPGYVFLTPADGAAPDGPMIIDDDGELIWLRPDSAGLSATDLGVATYRGEPVLTWWEGAGLTGYGEGTYVIADTSYREIARVRAVGGLQGDLHEVVLTPQGSALFICFNTVPGDVPTYRGDASGTITEGVIQEVDVASGRLLFEWHSADHVSPFESFLPMVKGPDEPYDYLHANAVDLGSDGSILLSARHTWAVYCIDRGSGAIRWRLGGSRSDFTMGPGVRFAWQHDARWLPDGSMSIYDDGADGPPPQFEHASRGIVLDLDQQAMQARLEREWVHPSGVLSSSQGSCQVLPNAGAFMGYGNVPRFSEFAAGGALLLDATFEGKGSYRALRFPWAAQPADAPTLVVDTSSGTPTAYASWNGATEVASWAFLGGATADGLAAIANAPRQGFETALVVPAGLAYVAVRALGADGRMLGTSAPVGVA